MQIRSTVWLLLALFACQTQNRPKASRAPDDGLPRGMGPIVETTPDPLMPKPGPGPQTGPTPTPDNSDSTPDGPSPMELPNATPIEAELGSVTVKENLNLPFGLPTMHRSGKAILISRSEYVLSWNRDTRNADWAAYKLLPSDLGDVPRTDFWTADPDLEQYLKESGQKAVAFRDYSGSCFDRGHQVPSADRTKDEESNRATFVMSNALPETPFLNQIIWAAHERKVRDLLDAKGCLWIVTGPIYGKEEDFIGSEGDIAVPEAAFKTVFGCEKPLTILSSVIMPNVNADGASRAADKDNCRLMKGKLSTQLEDYETDVKTIETKAFIQLPKP